MNTVVTVVGGGGFVTGVVVDGGRVGGVTGAVVVGPRGVLTGVPPRVRGGGTARVLGVSGGDPAAAVVDTTTATGSRVEVAVDVAGTLPAGAVVVVLDPATGVIVPRGAAAAVGTVDGVADVADDCCCIDNDTTIDRNADVLIDAAAKRPAHLRGRRTPGDTVAAPARRVARRAILSSRSGGPSFTNSPWHSAHQEIG